MWLTNDRLDPQGIADQRHGRPGPQHGDIQQPGELLLSLGPLGAVVVGNAGEQRVSERFGAAQTPGVNRQRRHCLGTDAEGMIGPGNQGLRALLAPRRTEQVHFEAIWCPGVEDPGGHGEGTAIAAELGAELDQVGRDIVESAVQIGHLLIVHRGRDIRQGELFAGDFRDRHGVIQDHRGVVLETRAGDEAQALARVLLQGRAFGRHGHDGHRQGRGEEPETRGDDVECAELLRIRGRLPMRLQVSGHELFQART